jgi:hypothetical protein
MTRGTPHKTAWLSLRSNQPLKKMPGGLVLS